MHKITVRIIEYKPNVAFWKFLRWQSNTGTLSIP